MKRKKNVTYSVYLYAVYDKVACRLSCVHFAQNDAVAVRNIVRGYGYRGENFATSEVLCFGRLDTSFDDVYDVDTHLVLNPLRDYRDVFASSSIEFRHPRVVSWTAWRDIESPSELLAPLGVSETETKEILKTRTVGSEVK